MPPYVSDILVLCYHAISARWPADLAVTPAKFEEQLRYLVGRGYRGATFTTALTQRARSRTLVVTFDDAFRSVREFAVPVLDRLGLPATIFAPTAYVGSEGPMSWPGIDHWIGTPHGAELLPLSWEELRELVGAGWEVGSHTRTHPRLTQVDDAELARELGGSKEECEQRLGRPCTSIAYPFGDVDGRVAAAADRAGYRAGAALAVRRHRSRPLEWPRYGVSREDSAARFRRQVSPLVRRLRASPAGPAADRAGASLLGALRRRRS
jgi:peptidoglycan/xylan/chitin deacetylase (PgdA/CDA1 family)